MRTVIELLDGKRIIINKNSDPNNIKMFNKVITDLQNEYEKRNKKNETSK